MVGYVHNICVIIAPVIISCQVSHYSRFYASQWGKTIDYFSCHGIRYITFQHCEAYLVGTKLSVQYSVIYPCPISQVSYVC